MFCRVCGATLAHSIYICEACDSSRTQGFDASTTNSTIQQEQLLAQAASLSSEGINQSSVVELSYSHISSAAGAHPAWQEQWVKQLEIMFTQRLHQLELNFTKNHQELALQFKLFENFIGEQITANEVQRITATQQRITFL